MRYHPFTGEWSFGVSHKAARKKVHRSNTVEIAEIKWKFLNPVPLCILCFSLCFPHRYLSVIVRFSGPHAYCQNPCGAHFVKKHMSKRECATDAPQHASSCERKAGHHDSDIWFPLRSVLPLRTKASCGERHPLVWRRMPSVRRVQQKIPIFQIPSAT